MTPGTSFALDADGLIVGKADAIYTYTGRTIRPLDPNPDDIHIEDIAHALSQQCRFTGHTRKFYSVAEHCVHVARIVPEEFALEAILHDASEAYLSDIARPVKKAPGFSETYLAAELKLEQAISQAFRLPPPPMSPEVKAADELMLGQEIHDLCHPDFVRAYGPKPVTPVYPQCWSPQAAKGIFMDEFTHYWAVRERQKEELL